MRFRCIEDHRDIWPVRVLCAALEVSASGYYAWRGRPESGRAAVNRDLLADVRRLHEQHRRRYGAPRIHAALRAEGRPVSRGHIERLMRRHGIRAGVHQGLLRHSAAVRRPQRKESRMDGMMEKGGAEPADLAERPQEAGGDKSAGGPPAQRFAAKRKLRAVSRLLRGEPLELVARELNVTAARLSEWRDRAVSAAEAALKERNSDDRDDEIVRLKSKIGEMTMETELLREKIARLEAGAPLARRRSRP